MDVLPFEEVEDIDRIAEELARFTMIMLSQQLEQRASRLGMDVLAKSYLAQRTFEILLGDSGYFDLDD